MTCSLEKSVLGAIVISCLELSITASKAISEPLELVVLRVIKLSTFESVKAVSDLYVPASGEITEVNQQVISNPELLNEDPYNQGWLVKVRLNNPEELDSLLDSKSYINIIS